MKKIILLMFILILVLPIGSSSAISGKKNLKKHASNDLSKKYINGEVIVQYKNSANSLAKKKINAKAGINKTLKRVQKSKNIYLYQLKSGVSVNKALKELRQNPNVVCAEPNYIRKIKWVPNDTLYNNQWSLPKINIPEAWNIEKGYTNPVKVAVIDTGIDEQHPDLLGKVSGGYNWAGISQRSYTDSSEFGDNSYDTAFAQSIKGTGQPLTHIGLGIKRVGADTSVMSNIIVSVRSSLGGTNLASYIIHPSEVPTFESEIYKPLSTPVTLTKYHSYFIVAKVHSYNISNYYYILDNVEDGTIYDPDVYVDGYEYDRDGSHWVSYSNCDLYFHTNPNAYPRDDVGHGTLISGIIGAKTNNAAGVAGISAGVTIMPLKVADSAGLCSSSDLISAITYAADNGAKVINLSLAGTGNSTLEQQAVNYAHNKGVVIFASAGNDGDATVNYPAGYNYVVGVGSTNSSDNVSNFSNHNSSVDVATPGESILSTMPTYPVSFNSFGNTSYYQHETGTSFSAPMAAGLGALILSKRPNLTPRQVELGIENSSDDKGAPGRDDFYGFGRINAYRSLSSIYPPQTALVTSIGGSNGWYRRVPIITLARNTAGTTNYWWNGESHKSFTGNSYSFHAARGVNYFYYYSVNSYGDVSATQKKLFRVDDYRPKTYAPKRIIINRGQIAKLYWKVYDPYTQNKAFVTLRLQKKLKLTRAILRRKAIYLKRYKNYRARYIKTRQRKYNVAMHRYLIAYRNAQWKTVRNIRYRWTRINKTRYYKQRINTKGTYRLLVYAKDQAHNSERHIAVNYVYVR